MIALPPKKARKPSETGILIAVRDAISAMPDVWLERNNVGSLPDRYGRWISYGLGDGSSDLIGGITLAICLPPGCGVELAGTTREVQRVLALEVKKPGEPLDADQIAFGAMITRRGGAFSRVESVAEAVAFVEKVRRWEV